MPLLYIYIFYSTTKTDGMPTNIWLLPLRILYYGQQRKKLMHMGDASMMFVSHTHLVKFDAFVNKKKRTKNIIKKRKIAQSYEKEKDIDDRQLIIFSTRITVMDICPASSFVYLTCNYCLLKHRLNIITMSFI